MISIRRWINVFIPMIISLIIMLLWIFFIKETDFPGLKDVLNSIITFSSIVIGFYTAMYGVIVTIVQGSSRNIFEKMHEMNLENTFKFQLYFSLIISFLALTLSIIMQTRLLKNDLQILIFYIWLLIAVMLFIVSGTTMTFLIKLIFHREQKPRKKTKIQQ
ncbi:hypothetical protein [Weissella paramesenteroides]|uniref:DUF3021 domain-containing protein n=1 Tax=Weissella paramesenteroides TaxID=1249 RepID=A0ABD4XHD3_WEIPA|nr:hypothetical protein [Weissella paramesenteroides]KAA8446513.1 hypothetical protein FKV72_01665 [Weissella paramesenteroides]KAA8454591.1 hypothetical protein FKV71_02115 [Weissella paramesenteroides]MDF8368890.1 hypothetical protein [Weissella paramesenteroides]MDF8370719.1 hypothetical protein [Weissella paramesenteroides]